MTSAGEPKPLTAIVVALDLSTKELKKHLPHYPAGYQLVEAAFFENGFDKDQGTLYVGRNVTRAQLIAAVRKLIGYEWFRPAVKQFQWFEIVGDGSLSDLIAEATAVGDSA